VADEGNDTIRKVTSGGVVTALAGDGSATNMLSRELLRGYADGAGNAARFNNPSGVAVDTAGNVYVADTGNHIIRKITSSRVVTMLAGDATATNIFSREPLGGYADGSGNAARFNNPSGVAVDTAGNVYVADTGNHTIRRVTSGGVVTTIGGTAGVMDGVAGAGSSAHFASPHGIAVDSGGCLYVADTSNNRISKAVPLSKSNQRKVR
jgi:sugar lactone lactonase YvrE